MNFSHRKRILIELNWSGSQFENNFDIGALDRIFLKSNKTISNLKLFYLKMVWNANCSIK